MKYMTFRSSCSYAALANLLSYHGIDTEDRSIALQMGLPYLFAFEDGRYRSGPMLQGGKWFRLYLSPLGFTMTERQLSREEAVPYLRAHPPAMLGLRVTSGSKHAVIFIGPQPEGYIFLNNKHKRSDDPDTLCLSEDGLFSRLDETVTIGFLEKTEAAAVDLRPYLKQSLSTLQSLLSEIKTFCSKEQKPAAQKEALDALFRPILLDGVSMLELLPEEQIADSLRKIRSQLLAVVREERPAVLASRLDMSLLVSSVDEYACLIGEKMKIC